MEWSKSKHAFQFNNQFFESKKISLENMMYDENDEIIKNLDSLSTLEYLSIEWNNFKDDFILYLRKFKFLRTLKLSFSVLKNFANSSVDHNTVPSSIKVM